MNVRARYLKFCLVVVSCLLSAVFGFGCILDSRAGQHPGECVVLLHGLSRTGFSMKPIEWILRYHGYEVVNVTYPSRRLGIPELGDKWLPCKLRKTGVNDAVKVHFVTHSMGGIVLRRYLNGAGAAHAGRVVMLAAPNHGSDVAERFGKQKWFLRLFGPAGASLGTSRTAVPENLGPVTTETGVIAANRSMNPVFSAWLPGPDDGRVTVESSRVEGMKEHLVLRTTHSGILLNQSAIKAILRFLDHGSFDENPD